MTSPGSLLADWARTSETLLQSSLAHPGPLTLAAVFAGGLLTSLGPCSLSLLPVTLAYLAGFGVRGSVGSAPWQRSLWFAAGIVGSLVLLGLASGLLGRLYGQVPASIPLLVAVVAVLMGLNLLGLLRLPMPAGPDPEAWRRRVPAPLAPAAAGMAFGLAATPCTTPVLAVLLAWMARSGRPLTGMLLLACFGAGQVVPLLLAGTAAASLPGLLRLRLLGRWIPPISGVVLLTSGALMLAARLP
ncbi:MAG: cytochrome c biogenesis protein CcdA [Synechococcaceae cyanobacterium]|nr:cytochrome c biogenesis protein CcdA [Synechococcaceae cyanobacterium]